MQIVADANVMLAAVLGGKAKLVFQSEAVSKVFTTESAFREVEEYASVLARKRHLSLDFLLLALGSLPVTVVERVEYAPVLAEAKRRIGRRDPDDVEVLALVLHLKLPLWSNDRDFENTGIELFTTQHVLRRLGFI